MQRTDPQYKLRIPEDIKSKLEDSAKLNRRSLNAEIVARLENSLLDDQRLVEAMTIDEAADIEANAEYESNHTILSAIHIARRSVEEAMECLRLAEKLHDQATGEHILVSDDQGGVIKSYEQ